MLACRKGGVIAGFYSTIMIIIVVLNFILEDRVNPKEELLGNLLESLPHQLKIVTLRTCILYEWFHALCLNSVHTVHINNN